MIDLSECRVLLVDDTPANIDVLYQLLSAENIKLLVANSGESTIKIARSAQPDLILLDVEMPGMDGFETCSALKSDELTASIPVIFVTGRTDQSDIKKGFDLGGVDYICKPVQAEEAIARVRTHLGIQKLIQSQRVLIEKFSPTAISGDDHTASTSHELRAPLSSIIGFSRVIKRHAKKKDDTDLYDWAEIILSSGDYLLRLIGNMLDLAKSDAGKIELNKRPFSLSDLLTNVHVICEPLSEANNNQLIFRETDSITITGDETRVQQIIINLISNACKFTKEGTITVSVHQDDNFYNLAISDTGIGIEQSQLQSIFQPYHQATQATYSEYGGTGLGLSISYRLAKLMHGHITVTSTAGVGSCFSLHIPIDKN